MTEEPKNMSKHTPGPWPNAVFTGDHKNLIIECDGPDGDNWKRLYVRVDSDDCDRETAMANANLICMAPELLQCVQDALSLSISLPLGLRKQFEEAVAEATGSKEPETED